MVTLQFATQARLINTISVMEFLTPDCVTDVEQFFKFIVVTPEGYQNYISEYPIHPSIVVTGYEVTFDSLPVLSHTSKESVLVFKVSPNLFKCEGRNLVGNSIISLNRLGRFVKIAGLFGLSVGRPC